MATLEQLGAAADQARRELSLAREAHDLAARNLDEAVQTLRSALEDASK